VLFDSTRCLKWALSGQQGSTSFRHIRRLAALDAPQVPCKTA